MKFDILDKINETENGLKEFQKKTAGYVAEQLYEKGRNKMLVADEVGLGKTIVAKGVIAEGLKIRITDKRQKNKYHVVYICSNQALAAQNIKKLNITGRKEVVETAIDRLIFLAEKTADNNLPFNVSALTPNTSMNITRSKGKQEERALLFAMLTCYHCFSRSGRWDSLSKIMQGSVTSLSSWQKTLRYKENSRKIWLRNELKIEFANELRQEIVTKENYRDTFRIVGGNKSVWEALMILCDKISSNKIPDFKHRSFPFEIVVSLRRILTELSIKFLDADLFILDEFQRFKNIIDEEDENEASKLAKKVFEKENSKILMLSATPFKPYTTLAEMEMGEDHYAEFRKVLKFLMGREDPLFWQNFEKDRSVIYEFLRYADKGKYTLDDGIRAKRALEEMYKQGMVRTERNIATEDPDFLIEEKGLHDVDVLKEDIEQYKAFDEVVRALNNDPKLSFPQPVEYIKSASYPLSFMRDYKLRNVLDEKIKEPEINELLKSGKNLFLDRKKVEKYRPLWIPGTEKIPGTGKLRSLLNNTLYEDGWKMLWIPPALPYYKLKGPYEGQEGFSKTLIFSAWKMVPRMISSIASYEAERLMFKEASLTREERQALTYHPESGQRIPRPLLTFKLIESKPAGMSNFCLTYPSRTLSEVYNPLEGLKNGKSLEEIKRAIKVKLQTEFNNYSLSNYKSFRGNKEKWYWAGPLLLDAINHREELEEWLTNPHVRENLEEGESRERSKGIARHLISLREAINDPWNIGLGEIPEDLFEVMAEMAISSPGVCSLRTLGKAYPEDHTILEDAFDLANAFRNLFNKPDSISLVRTVIKDTEGKFYWEKVLHYCTAGNFQAMLDEFVHLLMDNENFHQDDAQRLAYYIADVVNINPSSVTIDDYESIKDGNPFRMRTHFAMEFGNQRINTDSGVNRMVNLRESFNSPFRPFILASTSIGQEGLDFHLYCRKVMHWNLPHNPIDLEQREGRINRYKGLVVRQNITEFFKHQLDEAGDDLWEYLFESGRKFGMENKKYELVPFWIFEGNKNLKYKIERHVPLHPFSEDIGKYESIRKVLALYRLTFGQPRQEDLLKAIERKGLEEEFGRIKDELIVQLAPVKFMG